MLFTLYVTLWSDNESKILNMKTHLDFLQDFVQIFAFVDEINEF